MDALHELIDRQDGMISRRQALDHGMTEGRVRSLLRRRAWVVVHPGVYATHTGALSWQQRAWVAVLACWPAALVGRSALRAIEGPGRRELDAGPLEVAVARDRAPAPPHGVRIHRTDRLEAVQWHRYPPRQSYDAAVLVVADRAADDLSAIGWLAEACGSRRTTAERLRKALAEMPRARRREFLDAVLVDVAEGTCSVLEHAYRHRVERAHGLPRSSLQVAARSHAGRSMLRDVEYADHGLIVELDGRLFHDSARARDADMERDLDAALDGLATVRLGYGQAMVRYCSTATKIAALLGEPFDRCPDCP